MANKLKAALANSVGTPATKPTESVRVVQAPPPRTGEACG